MGGDGGGEEGMLSKYFEETKLKELKNTIIKSVYIEW